MYLKPIVFMDITRKNQWANNVREARMSCQELYDIGAQQMQVMYYIYCIVVPTCPLDPCYLLMLYLEVFSPLSAFKTYTQYLHSVVK